MEAFGSFFQSSHIFLPLLVRFLLILFRIHTTTDTTNAFEISFRRIHIYILKQRNEFWRHAPRGRTEGTFIYMRFLSLTRLFRCVAAVCAAMRRNPIHLFFLLSRARVTEASISSFAKMMISLFTHCSGGSSFLVGVFQNALLRERERERDKQMCFPISPKTREKEREDQRLISPNKKKCKREGKKTNRQPKHIKEREREREKESVFFKERETFFLLSLSPFSVFPGGRSELKSRQTFFVSPRDTDLISLSLLLLHVTMKYFIIVQRYETVRRARDFEIRGRDGD